MSNYKAGGVDLDTILEGRGNWLLGTGWFAPGDKPLWACGYNYYGQLGQQLGQGDITNYSLPVQVGTLTTWSQIAGGFRHTLATKTDGTLWAWGYNNYGQLGTGDSYINYSSPVQVGSLTTWSKIAGGRYHTLATQQY